MAAANHRGWTRPAYGASAPSSYYHAPASSGAEERGGQFYSPNEVVLLAAEKLSKSTERDEDDDEQLYDNDSPQGHHHEAARGLLSSPHGGEPQPQPQLQQAANDAKNSGGAEVDDKSWMQQRVEAAPIATPMLVCGVMLALSAGLIAYNKYLIHGAFPYAIALTAWHMLFCSFFSVALYSVRPDWFPTAQGIRHGGTSLPEVMLFLGPLALCFGCGVVLSNVAYKYATISFIQMMKELNVVIVYSLSLLVGLEKLHWRLLLILCWIVFASYFSISGEAKFVAMGFVVQLSSQLFECTRIVGVNKVLSNSDWCVKKVDPLSFLLLVSPCCFLALLVALAFSWESAIYTAGVANLGALLGNGLVALGLNVCMALMMSAFAAITFVIVGVVKTVLIVLTGIVVFSESVSSMQVFGFSCQVIGAALYSYQRVLMAQEATAKAAKGVEGGEEGMGSVGGDARSSAEEGDSVFGDGLGAEEVDLVAGRAARAAVVTLGSGKAKEITSSAPFAADLELDGRSTAPGSGAASVLGRSNSGSSSSASSVSGLAVLGRSGGRGE
eukprot:g17123.t1